MCLDLHNNPTSTKGIETKGNFFVGYKALVISPWGTDAWEVTSMNYSCFSWGLLNKKRSKFTLSKDAKQLKESSRETTSLSHVEELYGVNFGFHFYVKEKDAIKDNPNDSLIVECLIPKDCFVAQGTFLYKSFVSTKTKINRIVKLPTGLEEE